MGDVLKKRVGKIRNKTVLALLTSFFLLSLIFYANASIIRDFSEIKYSGDLIINASRLIITNATNNPIMVGIGTTTPAGLLNINGTGDTLLNVTNESADLFMVNETMAVFGDGINIKIANDGYIDTGTVSGYSIYLGDKTNTDQHGNLYIKGSLDGTSSGLRVYPRDEAGAPVTYAHLGYSSNSECLTLGTASDLDSLVIDTSGSVGIGTTTPSATLEVAGSLNVTQGNTTLYGGLEVVNSSNSANSYLYVDNETGNVGIGTTSPGALLDVYGSEQSIRISDSDTSGFAYGEEFGSLEFYSEGAYGNGPRVGAYIKALHLRAGTGHTASDMGLAFGISGLYSDDVYQTAYTAMVINNLGNVGIGTTSPGAKLEVDGTFNATGASGVTGLYVENTGMVGIGTTNPNAPLHVTKTWDDPDATMYNVYNSMTIADAPLSAARSHYGGFNFVYNDLQDNTYDNSVFGAYNRVQNSVTDGGQANITNAYGTYSYVINYANATLTAENSTITNAYGAFNFVLNNRMGNITTAYGTANVISTSDAQRGTMNTAYGVWNDFNGNINTIYGVLNDFSGVTGGTSYGIYTTGEDKNYFSGSVGIGTSSPSHILELAYSNGTYSEINPGWTTFTVGSSKEFKENFEDVDEMAVLDKMRVLPIKKYNLKKEAVLGLLADSDGSLITGASLMADKIKEEAANMYQGLSEEQKAEVDRVDSEERIGPMSEDFYQLFGWGEPDRLSGDHLIMANMLATKALIKENDMLKSELCRKDSTYSWCKKGVESEQLVIQPEGPLQPVNETPQEPVNETLPEQPTEQPAETPVEEIPVEEIPVNLTNSVPVVESFMPEGDVVLSVGEAQEFTITSSDADNDTLSVQWFVNDLPVEGQTSGSFEYWPSEAGEFEIKVLVTDSKDYSTHKWHVTVNEAGGFSITGAAVGVVSKGGNSLLGWLRSLF